MVPDDLQAKLDPQQARELTHERLAYVAQTRLAAIVDGSDDAIVSKDLDGNVRSWNRGAQLLFGYTAEEMIGESILRVIPPDRHHEERRILARIAAGERIEHYETVRRHRDGRLVEVSLTVSPLKDFSGRIIGASKIARDISGRREEELAKAVLASVVQSADDAIISKSLDGVITSWNPAAERMYGYRAEEIVGQPVLRIIPPELHQEESRILAEVRGGNRISHYETVRMRKDGSRVKVSLTVSPVRGPGGEIVGASKIARDISAQHDAQRKKDHFLAVLAHELRNPLAPIRNTLSLMRSPDLAAEQRERALVMAERQMSHLTRLLDDLLDVTRITTGRVELKLERVDLGVLVRQAVDFARPHVESRRHELVTRIPAEPIWIVADAVRISQVVSNLLTNAAKYTDPGGRVELTVEREGDSAWVRVADNGIGFTAAMKERLFLLFEQEDDVSARAAGGLGIGLALVREFVERHGGSVEAASPGRGRGSVFSARLPLVA
jgi:PAS domain S-box-containing protein